MDILTHNRLAWDKQVESGNRWTVPVGPEITAAAKRGEWTFFLTPIKPAPRTWFPPLTGLDVLCLASGGGQQGPIFAAAGANVTVFDNSPRQLAQDRFVAQRDGLSITTVAGDMADLSMFPPASFDLVFHPVSNNFAPAVRPVWREAFRVLRPGSALLAAFGNPVLYIFDLEQAGRGILQVRHALPYSDVDSLSEEQKQRCRDEGSPFEFSHTLEDQLGGQADAGFLIAGLYEDYSENADDALGHYMPTYIATRAIKPVA